MRLLLIALFMALATHVGAQEGQGVAPENPAAKEQPDGSANDTGGNSWKSALPVKVIESPDEAKDRRDREQKAEQHETDDLDAQRRAAKAAESSAAIAEGQIIPTWIQATVAVVGTIALIFTVWSSIKATNAAVAAAKAAEITNVMTREEQRAWININLVAYRELQPRYGGGGFYSQITLVLENTGKSIATDVRAFIKPYVLDTDDKSPRVDSEQWLKDRIDNRHPDEISRTIFPGEAISSEPDLAMRGDELKSNRFILRVAAMVEYTTAQVDNPRRAYTNFDITGSDDGGISRVIMLDESALPVERMRIRKTGIGYAT